MAIQEGERIYVESLLSPTEWNTCSKIYSTYSSKSQFPIFFESEFSWRKNMGGFVPDLLVDKHNRAMDKLLELVKK